MHTLASNVRFLLPALLAPALMFGATVVHAETTGADTGGTGGTGDPTTGSDPDTSGGIEQPLVVISAPASGAQLGTAPAMAMVDVELTEAMTLALLELRVDGVVHEMACEAAAMCTFTIELEEGVHNLQAQATFDKESIALSPIVMVSVSGAAGATDGPATSGNTDGQAGTDGGSSGGGGCTVHGPGSTGGALTLGLLVLAGLGRRRRND